MILAMFTTASARSNRGLLVFGEFFIDLVFYNLAHIPRMGEELKTASFARFPGGGVATTALVAAKLGTPTNIVTRVGRDAQFSPEWKKMAAGGVSTRGTEIDERFPTAITVCAAFEGDRALITHDAINAKLERLLASGAVQKQVSKARHLHLACAMRTPQKWTAALKKIRKRGLTVSTDSGWNPESFDLPGIAPLLRLCEFSFPNAAEAKAMTGKKTVEAAARELARFVRIPVIKLGADGSVAIRDGKMVRMKSIRVRAVDATGAGDAFNGGFLHGYLAGWPLEECMRAGNVCGALATTGAGGSAAIPTRQKLEKWMKKLR
jgi:sugar/nucleoside kinase (ribokinase family)